MAKKKAERFDAAGFAAAKLAWVRKAVGNARRCAVFYGMDEAELRELGHFLATGEVLTTQTSVEDVMDRLNGIISTTDLKAGAS